MFRHLLLIGECDTTNTLQGIVGLITEEVGGGVLSKGLVYANHRGFCIYPDLHDLEGLNLASALNVRTPAKIDQSTASVDSALLTSHKLVNVVQLVLAVGKHLL
jgi:hypothetical protein